jgi:hypothetical protein
MDWLKIGSALFLAAMLIYLFPRMRQAVQHGPKGGRQEWLGFVVIILVVALFVLLLIKLV